MRNQTAGLAAERAFSEARLTAETNEMFSPTHLRNNRWEWGLVFICSLLSTYCVLDSGLSMENVM